MKLVHVSDPHFGAHRPQVVDDLIRWIRACGPDLVVMSGDVTQRAHRSQFRQARAFVDALQAPTIAMPGNHDIPLFNLWARLRHPYRNYLEQFGPDRETSFERSDLMLLTVDTTRPGRHKHGEVSPQQIDRIADRLRGADAGQLRLVVTHQPVCVPRRSEAHNLVRGHAQALEAWTRAGVDIVLGGHIHLPALMPFDHAGRTARVMLAGTAVSARVRHDAGNSIQFVEWQPALGRCVLRRVDHDAKLGQAHGHRPQGATGWTVVQESVFMPSRFGADSYRSRSHVATSA